MLSTYQERNRVLKEMGFSSYREYLESPLWQTIRKVVISRDAGFCRLCGTRGIMHVHHISYVKSVLIGDRPEMLLTLCEGCHKKVEFDGSRKRSLQDSQRFLLETITKTKMVKGVSNPKIGYWFKGNYVTNRPVALEIKNKLEANHVSLSGM